MEALREIREARGWSQEKLAKEADVSPTTIVHAEAGRKHPHAQTLCKLAGALGVEEEDLTRPPYEQMSLEQLTDEGLRIRQQMVEATNAGDMDRLQVALKRGYRVSQEIEKHNPPIANIRLYAHKPPEVYWYREPTPEDIEKLQQGLGKYRTHNELLLIR